jgi:hypothetical protein
MRHVLFAVAAIAVMAVSARAQTPGGDGPHNDSDVLKPYKQVTVTAARPVQDAALTAFRAQVAATAKQRDKAALAALVIAKGFFWDRDGSDAADAKKSPIDNLSAAIGLENKDAAGLDMLAAFSQDPTGSASPDHPGTVCAPGDPSFDGNEMQALLDATGSDIVEWGYPIHDGVEVRDAPQAGAPVAVKLGTYFVRVTPDANAAAAVGALLRIVTPDGKFGYVSIDDIAPLGNDQICYAKTGNDWKIGGYVGAGSDTE